MGGEKHAGFIMLKRICLIVVFLVVFSGTIPFAGQSITAITPQQAFAASSQTIKMIPPTNANGPEAAEPLATQGFVTKSVACDIVSLGFRTSKANDFDLLELLGDRYDLYAERVGDPLLPTKIVYISVPQGAKLEDLNVKILHQKTLEQPFNIFPKQPETPTSQNYKGPFVNLRSGLAASNQPFPTSPVQFIETATVRGQSMLVFRIWPLQYVPATGSVIVNERFEWQFNARPGQFHALKYKKRAPGFEKMLEQTVINPHDLVVSSPLMPQTSEPLTSTVETTAGADCDYLIITSSALNEEFQPLANEKISMGLAAQIVTTESIAINYSGSDMQEQIKNCIIDYAANHGTVWVLLGGDDTVVPDRNCYGLVNPGPKQTEDNTIPTDLYYAGLDDLNWDDDNDDVKCEVIGDGDSVDLYPDVFIGRAPVRTVSDANAFVAKTMAYTSNPPLNDFAEIALLCGVELWHTWDGKSDAHWRTEDMWNDYMEPHWDGVRYRFYDTGTDFPGGADYDVTDVHLQAQVDNGYGLIFVASHGGQTVWGMESGSNFGTLDAQGCANASRQGIIYTMACNTNAFEQEEYPYETCLSEAFLRNSNGGAVAFIGSSRYGWGNGLANTTPGTSIRYAREFFHHLFDDTAMESGQGSDPDPSDYSRRLGAVHASHKMFYAGLSTTYGSYRWIQFALNLMGDPYLKVLIEDPLVFDPPMIENIQFDEYISELETSNISVTANDPSGGNLTYVWEALDGGDIIGSGENVAFDPPDAGPHPLPYRVKVTVTSDLSGLSASETINIYISLEGDNDYDGDVDGNDLAAIIGDSNGLSLADFAANFGNSECP